jgi:site-specific DNA-methyltransferase (adenine-specific)
MSVIESFLNGRAALCCGDSWHFLKDQPDNRYDSVVTDPPYALVSISKRLGSANAAPVIDKGSGAYKRAAKGFMGKTWDVGDVAFSAEFWTEVLRVLKPGGHIVAFGGTRTYHRLACAIEDAGFEIRDCLSWNYGSGFPKSRDAWKSEMKEKVEAALIEQGVEGDIKWK